MKFAIALFLSSLAAVQVQVHAEFPPAGNEFIPPGEGDVRSPCPFINTLANHGFIDRSGKEVDLFAMVDRLAENFDVTTDLFLKLANGAIGLNFTTTDANGTIRMDIDEMFAHNKQEHDASFVRADEYFGREASYLVDTDLLSALMGTNPDSDVLTQNDLMEFQRSRILDSRVNNPEYFFDLKQTTSFSAQATLLLAFGQDPELISVNKSKLEYLLANERFPEDYEPQSLVSEDFVPLNVIGEGTLANEIRLSFAASFEEAISQNLTSDDMADTDESMEPDDPGDDSSAHQSAGTGRFTVVAAVTLSLLFVSL